MKNEQVTVDEYAWGALFAVCASNGNLTVAKQLHAELLDSKQALTTSLWNGLVSMYAKCGSFEIAFKIFNEIVNEYLE